VAASATGLKERLILKMSVGVAQHAVEPLPITVIIPAHNRAHMLRRALASVWAQVPAAPKEVIVVDDASEDDTADVAKEMKARVVRHTQNCGPSAARNTGLRVASHSWIALLDSDDEWLPCHLAQLWKLREGHVLVSSSALRCGEPPIEHRFDGPLAREPIVLHSADQLVYPSNIVNTSASLLRRDLALDLGGFSTSYRMAEDFDLWLRLLESGTAICSPRVTVIKHLHGAQTSRNRHLMRRETLAAAEAHRRRVDGSTRPVRRLEGAMAWDALRSATRCNEWHQVARCTLYLARNTQRVVGLAGLLVRRRRSRLMAAELRRQST
jgi:GT2 family glycosyltransferase